MKTMTSNFQNDISNELIFDFKIRGYYLDEMIGLGEMLSSCLLFTSFLFFVGLLGMVFNHKNFLVAMLAIELMYLGAVSSFVLYGAICHDPRCAIYGLILLIIVACESAVGLGVLILVYRFDQTIFVEEFQTLGG
jgi:NADH-quinone oxidoreductase subunit K